jgi:hypothetical protein
MFADLTRLISRRSSRDYEDRFVKGVRTERSPRNPRVERVLVAGWIVIGVKTLAVLWLFRRYSIPVNPLWVIAPTIVFAAVCTLIYFLRD